MSIYRGRVLDNQDPEMLGRIKAEVYPMLLGTETAIRLNQGGGIETDRLPWAVPAFPLATGAGDGHGAFAVPEVGSFVFVFFENKNIYQPVYFAEAADGIHGLPPERTTDYPFCRVLKTKSGHCIAVNDKGGHEEIRIQHSGGSVIVMGANGDISITAKQNLHLVANGSVYIQGSTVEIN